MIEHGQLSRKTVDDRLISAIKKWNYYQGENVKKNKTISIS